MIRSKAHGPRATKSRPDLEKKRDLLIGASSGPMFGRGSVLTSKPSSAKQNHSEGEGGRSVDRWWGTARAATFGQILKNQVFKSRRRREKKDLSQLGGSFFFLSNMVVVGTPSEPAERFRRTLFRKGEVE